MQQRTFSNSNIIEDQQQQPVNLHYESSDENHK